MPKMIPTEIDPNTKSNAEKSIFRALKNMPDTEDWTVIHSLGIAKHPTQAEGEADFTVVIPNKGLFVLEIKGGDVSFDDGKWFSESKDGNTYKIKDPIEEAQTAMYSIRDYIVSHGVQGKLLYGYGAIFPDTEMDELEIPDVDKKQIGDIDACFNLKDFLLSLASYWKSKSNEASCPTKEQCKQIVELLRPQFTSKISLKTVIKNYENQIIQLTDRQQDIFDGLSENDRCLVKGEAGTGKTIIAVNFANQKAEEGNKVALFCYNTKLADFLNKSVIKHPNLVCGSFTEYAYSIVNKYYPEKVELLFSTNKDKFYREDLPRLLIEAYIDKELEQFDCIILDEAQDLMTQEYLEAFDTILKKGLSGGKWSFFMDAAKQNLFNKGQNENDIFELLNNKSEHYTKYTLKENCRNSIQIIKKIDQWFGSNTKSYFNQDCEYEVVVKGCKKPKNAAEKLTEILAKLKKEGVEESLITILSPKSLKYSCANEITEYKISEDEEHSKDSIFFSTIGKFKGMENSVIILTDIDGVFKEEDKNLLYVGITRAKEALFIITSEHVGKILLSDREL